MGASERRKGAVAERELHGLLVDRLGEAMVVRRRGSDQAADGGLDLEVRQVVEIEVKRQERANLAQWLAQAKAGGREGLPTCVAWRRSREGWCVVMTLEDWVALVREAI